MAKRIKVGKGQALVRFKLENSDRFYLDLRDATISAHLAYKIYKMILDDQGRSEEPDLEAIFGPCKLRGAMPKHPASVTAPPGVV